MMIIRPSPVVTLVPDRSIGEGIECGLFFSYSIFFTEFFFLMHISNVFFFIGLVSPVIALSSALISLASIKIPSAGTSIPAFTSTISPTRMKS